MDSAVEFQPRSNRPSQKRNRVSHVCTNCRRRRQFVSISSSTGAWIRDSHKPSVIDARPALHVFVASRKVLAATSLQQTSTCRAVIFTKSTLTAHRNASRDVHLTSTSVQDATRSSAPTLESFGYSAFNDFNSVGIVRRVDQERGSRPLDDGNLDATVTLSLSVSNAYARLLRRLPPRLYLEPLISIYFKEVNWHYSYLEENIFAEEFNAFYPALTTTPLAVEI